MLVKLLASASERESCACREPALFIPTRIYSWYFPNFVNDLFAVAR